MGRSTMPEIRAFVERCPAAIVPLGSTEQHGPHLPTATDTLIAARMASECARLSCGLVLPPIPLGYAWVWQGVPSCLTLSFDTYMRMVRDTVESLASWGVQAVYLMSGHGSNPQPLKHALREMIDGRIAMHVLYGMYGGLAEMTRQADSDTWRGDFHADEIETSLMLAIEPELVNMGLAVCDYPDAPADYGMSDIAMRHVMRTGVFGDATRASAEKGQRWLALGAERSAAQWLAFLDSRNIPIPNRKDQQ